MKHEVDDFTVRTSSDIIQTQSNVDETTTTHNQPNSTNTFVNPDDPADV